MKNNLIFLFLLVIGTTANAQEIDLPPNPKAGKCYEKCFQMDKKLEWKEVDCEKLKAEKNRIKTNEELVLIETKRQEIKNYQEELKNNGHDVDVTGNVDYKTIIAHHDYLKKKKKKKSRS